MTSEPVETASDTRADRTRTLLGHFYRALLVGTLTLLPLSYAKGLLNDIYNTPKLSLVMVVVALAGSTRVALTILGEPSDGLRRLWIPAGAMTGAFFLAWLFSAYRDWSLFGSYVRFEGLIPYLSVIIFGLLLADAFAGRPRPPTIALALGGAAAGAVALFQMVFTGFQVGRGGADNLVSSTIGHPNFAGGYMAIMLVLSVSLWLEEGTIARIGMGCTVFTACGVLFTASQGAWVAAFAGLVVVIGSRLDERRPGARRLALWVAGGVAAAVFFSVFATLFIPHAIARVPSIFYTTVSRGYLWEHALRLALERPILGWGPNVFSLEGPLHRSLEDALLGGSAKGDNPHSVPLAMLANLGIVGLAAFLGAGVWGLKRAARMPPSSLRTGLTGALVAYLVQSLVSIDETALRFAFWSLLAVAASQGAASLGTRDTNPGILRWAGAGVALAVGMAGAVGTLLVLPLADRKVKEAGRLFAGGQIEEGRARFEQALRLRGDNEYKRLYAGWLGTTAYRLGEEGAPLIQDMNQVFAYLGRYQDVQAIIFKADLMNQWSTIQPSANSAAIRLYEKARRLDPYNPQIAVGLADALMLRSEPASAEEVLQPYAETLTTEYPEFRHLHLDLFAGLAIAQLKQGNIEEAEANLELAESENKCRYFIALELLARARNEPSREGVLGLVCPRTLLQLVPERQEGTAET